MPIRLERQPALNFLITIFPNILLLAKYYNPDMFEDGQPNPTRSDPLSPTSTEKGQGRQMAK
jgi:hypothetical protein